MVTCGTCCFVVAVFFKRGVFVGLIMLLVLYYLV